MNCEATIGEKKLTLLSLQARLSVIVAKLVYEGAQPSPNEARLVCLKETESKLKNLIKMQEMKSFSTALQ